MLNVFGTIYYTIAFFLSCSLFRQIIYHHICFYCQYLNDFYFFLLIFSYPYKWMDVLSSNMNCIIIVYVCMFPQLFDPSSCSYQIGQIFHLFVSVVCDACLELTDFCLNVKWVRTCDCLLQQASVSGFRDTLRERKKKTRTQKNSHSHITQYFLLYQIQR